MSTDLIAQFENAVVDTGIIVDEVLPLAWWLRGNDESGKGKSPKEVGAWEFPKDAFSVVMPSQYKLTSLPGRDSWLFPEINVSILKSHSRWFYENDEERRIYFHHTDYNDYKHLRPTKLTWYYSYVKEIEDFCILSVKGTQGLALNKNLEAAGSMIVRAARGNSTAKFNSFHFFFPLSSQGVEKNKKYKTYLTSDEKYTVFKGAKQ